MLNKKQKNIDSVKKTIVLFGLAAIIVSIAANLYSAYFNRNSIDEPLVAIYYLSYTLLLGGGFGIGYFLTPKKTKERNIARLFAGVIYAVLATSLFLLTDILRAVIGDSLGFPWGKILFFGSPLFGLLVAIVIALYVVVWRRQSTVNITAKLIFIGSFVLYQIYIITSTIYDVLIGTATYVEGTSPLLIIGSYLITPLVITGLAYLFLVEKSRFERVFYASIVGSLYALLQLTLRDFNTDPSFESFETASLFIILSSLLFSAALLWNLRLKRGKR